jgi:SAM-dependent methyltransferase
MTGVAGGGRDEVESFLERFASGLASQAFAKLILGRHRGDDPGLIKVIVRPVLIKGQVRLSCLSHYETKDVTRNIPAAEGPGAVRALLGSTFMDAHLFLLTEDLHLKIDAAGKARLTRGAPSQRAAVSLDHDRSKQRRLDSGRPFLHALGIADARGKIIPAMSHKWKQIDKFLELFAQAFAASTLAKRRQVRLVDFGCGKGYLTFALHDYLRNTLGLEAQVTGIELREELVRFCNEAAVRLGCEGLTFRQGGLDDAATPDMDVMVALHACDTATDLALYKGMRAGAAIILCAPCCHKQLRPQLQAPEVLQPLLRFGVHAGQEADMVTDGLRALLLEAAGYQVGVFEFISLEHTDKNKMISGVKKAGPVASARIQAQIDAIKAFYGIREHQLETLLKAGAAFATESNR